MFLLAKNCFTDKAVCDGTLSCSDNQFCSAIPYIFGELPSSDVTESLISYPG
jgi:hypothetical protein